jgi:hypothetical protein
MIVALPGSWPRVGRFNRPTKSSMSTFRNVVWQVPAGALEGDPMVDGRGGAMFANAGGD